MSLWTIYSTARSLHTVASCAGYLKVRGCFTGTLHVAHRRAAGDGVFATDQGGDITLVDLKTNTTKKLVTKNDVTDVSEPAL